MTAEHVFGPAHASLGCVHPVVCESVGHENMQSVSQPVPTPLLLPKSHCSGDSTTPSPHVAEAQCPDLQIPLVIVDVVQVVPSVAAAPAVHLWVDVEQVPVAVHESAALQLWAVSSPPHEK